MQGVGQLRMGYQQIGDIRRHVVEGDGTAVDMGGIESQVLRDTEWRGDIPLVEPSVVHVRLGSTRDDLIDFRPDGSNVDEFDAERVDPSLTHDDAELLDDVGQ